MGNALQYLWRRPQSRALHAVAAAVRGRRRWPAMLGLLPTIDAVVGGSQDPPSWHWATLLGTDVLGRSVFYRVLSGAQTAMTIGLVTTALVIPVGTALGLAAGYFGGWVDAAINWLYSVVVSIPDILLITAISYSLGRGIESMCVALAATQWVGIMRLVRGEVLKHKGQRIRAGGTGSWARARGASCSARSCPTCCTWASSPRSLVLLGAVKSEVILTYLGIGVQDGASWGLLISGASQDLTNDIWWPLAGTVTAMFGLIYSLSVVGDSLRDALDPRTA